MKRTMVWLCLVVFFSGAVLPASAFGAEKRVQKRPQRVRPVRPPIRQEKQIFPWEAFVGGMIAGVVVTKVFDYINQASQEAKAKRAPVSYQDREGRRIEARPVEYYPRSRRRNPEPPPARQPSSSENPPTPRPMPHEAPPTPRPVPQEAPPVPRPTPPAPSRPAPVPDKGECALIEISTYDAEGKVIATEQREVCD